MVEAIPREEDFFNFEARYEIGRTEYVCPAELADEETERVQELATRTYETLGCSGFARVDLMLGEDGPQVLEVNAIPGLTDTSLFPMAAEAAGIDFDAAGRADPRFGLGVASRRGHGAAPCRSRCPSGR